MAHITRISGAELQDPVRRDPELLAAADAIADAIVLSAQKAIAHVADRRAYPLPANPVSFERLFADLAVAGPQGARDQGVLRAASAFTAAPLRSISRPNAGRFASIDLQSTEEITSQLRQLSSLPAPSGVRGGLRHPVVTPSAATPVTVRSGKLGPGLGTEPRSTLQWRLRHVWCNTETGATSYGSDHLYLGGVLIDAFGNSSVVNVVDLTGGWDTDNDMPFDITLATNDLSVGIGWPRDYTLVTDISVRGSDKLWTLLDRIVTYTRAEVVRVASAAAGSAVGVYVGAGLGALGGPLGALAGAAVGAIVGYVLGYVIEKVWAEIKDWATGTKLFAPATWTASLGRHGDTFGGNLSGGVEIWFKGHQGKYTLAFENVLAWIPESVPTAIARGETLMELVRVAENTNVQFKTTHQHGQGWSWSDWIGLQDAQTTPDAPICMVRRAPHLVDAFLIGFDGLVYTAARDTSTVMNSAWRGWWPIPGADFVVGTAVTAVSRGASNLDVFVAGKDWNVWTAAWGPQTNGEWTGWWTLGAAKLLPGTPIAAVSRSAGLIDLFAVGLDGRVWSSAFGPDGADVWNWSDWFSILDHQFVPGSQVTVVSRQPNDLDLFATDVNGEVWTASWSPSRNNAQWAGWWRIVESDGSFAPGTPVAVASRGANQLDVFAIGFDGGLWTAAWGEQTGGAWKGWWKTGDATFAVGSTLSAISRSPNTLDVFVNGFDGNIWCASWDGGWKQFPV